MSGDWSSQVIFFIILAFFLLWGLTRRKKAVTNKLAVIRALVFETEENLRILNTRMNDWRSKKKFKVNNWRLYKGKLDYLDVTLQKSLNEAFTLAEDFNARIDSARKNKSMALLQDMPLEKMQEPLRKSKDGLTNWFKANYHAEMQGRGGIFGGS